MPCVFLEKGGENATPTGFSLKRFCGKKGDQLAKKLPAPSPHEKDRSLLFTKEDQAPRLDTLP